MLEFWDIGYNDQNTVLNGVEFLSPIIPLFQHSNIPIGAKSQIWFLTEFFFEQQHLRLILYSNSSESKIASATWRMDFRESMLRF